MSRLLNEHEFTLHNVSLDAPVDALNGTLIGFVTYIKTSEGYHVMSRYEEDKWIFPRSSGTAAQSDSSLKLNFSRIKGDEQRRMAKWVILNSIKEGNAVNTHRSQLNNLSCYFHWVNQSKVVLKSGLNAFTSCEYVKYVNSFTFNQGKHKGSPLAVRTRILRFLTLELLYKHCKYFHFVKEHPWIESSSHEQAGYVGVSYIEAHKSKTEIIPDDILKPLCNFTKAYLARADELLCWKEKFDAFVTTVKSESAKYTQKNKYLQSLGYQESIKQFQKELFILRDSCLFWILLTTGMRIHEVLGIKCGEDIGYRKETKDDEVFYYVKSVSKKTYEGLAEWIAPKIAIDAIKILERYSSSLQVQLIEQISRAKTENNIEEVERLTEISGAIALTFIKNQPNKITTPSGNSISSLRLPNLCKLANVNWKLTAHQFRRTFANHAVHSELGDLRALKEHFNHWSLKMSALYAENQSLDQELFDEMVHERYLVDEEIRNDLFSLKLPISGGYAAKQLLELRASDENVITYPSRTEMVQAFASSIPFHATGIGWCINDDGICIGSCNDCDHGIMDYNHIERWKGMLTQQLELSEMTDIGRSGQHAVKLGLERCEKVLNDFGVDVESIKREFSNKNKVI